LRTVITHGPDAVGLETLVALAVTYHPVGGSAGAVYLPVVSMRPTVVFPPTMPLTDQVTAVVAAPVTVAVSCRSLPTGRVTDVGETVTVWAAASSVAAISKVRMRPSGIRLEVL
jgi:hypothetical protein